MPVVRINENEENQENIAPPLNTIARLWIIFDMVAMQFKVNIKHIVN